MPGPLILYLQTRYGGDSNQQKMALRLFCLLTQVFDFFVRIQFKFKYGLYEKNNSFLYVSSGSGTWGPKMRLGTYNEVILFNLSLK